jgi:hypothetical protein
MKKTISLCFFLLFTVFSVVSQENISDIIAGKWEVNFLIFDSVPDSLFMETNISDPNKDGNSGVLYYSFHKDGKGIIFTDDLFIQWPLEWKVEKDKYSSKSFIRMSYNCGPSVIKTRLYFARIPSFKDKLICILQYVGEDGYRVMEFTKVE